MTPQLVEIKGEDILDKLRYCSSYNECANTNLEAVFRLILNTAVKNHLPQSDMPEKELFHFNPLLYNAKPQQSQDCWGFVVMLAARRKPIETNNLLHQIANQ